MAASVSTGKVHLFGVRHHGPGSARSLVHALEALSPACLLIEGPPEANDLLKLAVHPGLTPPVALLISVTDRTGDAALYPFATFSPEWQAIRFALARGLPVRFIDLPISQRSTSVQVPEAAAVPESAEAPPEAAPAAAVPSPGPPADPLAEMARAAGYSDTERWWDHLVESRSGRDLEVFGALHEMFTELRVALDGQAHLPATAPQHEQLREAHMRQCIRAAVAEGLESIAVVCGAYHTPALAANVPAREDAALLKGLPRPKAEAAWVPWSYERLSAASGYGAGIESPLWYELLWERRDSVGPAWITRAARLLREADVPISSAHVIETVRLADSLSALRGRPIAGLPEYRDSAVSVLGNGEARNLDLIHSRWHFDGRLGKVPEDFPAAPLQQDFQRWMKRLEIKPRKDAREPKDRDKGFALQLDPLTADLDLREARDRERSLLLRRLRILGIEWGQELGESSGAKGSFREGWRISWQPEMLIRLIESSHLGHTIEQAATTRLAEQARSAPGLTVLIDLLEHALYADLPAGLAALIQATQDEAAASTDVSALLQAIPRLVRLLRYGNARGTDMSRVAGILAGLVPRMLISLPIACTGIDADAARALWKPVRDAGEHLVMLGDAGHLAGWHDTLKRMHASGAVHPLLAGCAGRLLYDAHAIDVEALARSMSLALSPGTAPDVTAAWVEGLLSGGAGLLIHDERLRTLLDDWVRDIHAEHFVQTLPLLRRAFAQTDITERRALGERLTGRPSRAAGGVSPVPTDVDAAAAAAVVPVLSLIWQEKTAS